MNGNVTLAEEVLLLTMDDGTGAVKESAGAACAIPGALLAELAMAERVVVEDGTLTVVGREPTGEPLLDGRLDRLAAWAPDGRGGKASDWLAKDRATALTDTLERLVERGLVVEERHRALGIFPVRRYPEADGSVEHALRERLTAVVLHGAEPDLRTGTLIALLHAARLYWSAFPEVPRKQVEARFAEIAEGNWAGESVQQTIRNTQTALVAVTAMIAASAATTAATM